MTATDAGTAAGVPSREGRGGCYRVQVLVVGRQKAWRDAISADVRAMGYQPTACDRGTDAMTVLALGLPVDVLVIDAALQGNLCCASLALEARALRPSLRIVLSGDRRDGSGSDAAAGLPGALTVLRDGLRGGTVARTVRAALASRAA